MNLFIKFIYSKPHFKYMENSCIIIIYPHIYGLLINPHNDLLPFGQIAQLVELCTSIAEVRVRISEIFRPFLLLF